MSDTAPPPYTNPTATAMKEIIDAVTNLLFDCYSNWDMIYEPDGKPTFDEYLQHHFIEEALMSKAYGLGTAELDQPNFFFQKNVNIKND